MPQSPVKAHADVLRDRLAGMSRILARLTAEVEQAAAKVDRIPTPGVSSASDLAATLIHELTWGFANLGLYTLVQRAADFDRVARESEPRSVDVDDHVARALDLISRFDPTSGSDRARAFCNDLRVVLGGA